MVRRSSLIALLITALCMEKVVQHAAVTIAFYLDIGGIRSSVSVDYWVLMIAGALIAVLFMAAIYGLILRKKWGIGLAATLAAVDIIGEFIVQGTLMIAVNISFLVAVFLLVLCYLWSRDFGLSLRCKT